MARPAAQAMALPLPDESRTTAGEQTITREGPAGLSPPSYLGQAPLRVLTDGCCAALSVVRWVKGMLKVIESGKRKHGYGGWKCQAPQDSHRLRPIRRGKEEETGGHQRNDRQL